MFKKKSSPGTNIGNKKTDDILMEIRVNGE